MKKTIARIAIFATIISPFALPMITQAATPNWNTTGNYVVAFNYLGTDYAHDMALTQDGLGNLTGNGGSPAGGPLVYTWVLTSGSVSGNTIDFYANYTATADAVTPQTVLHVTGTVATSTMSGTWSDNYAGGSRSGTWTTTSGTSTPIVASLAAEDFGVVNYDTGLGILKGYTAGFGLTNATFAGVQSVVVQLYSGGTLLQTNTATALVGTTILGSQISSPFDVSGTFNYVTDGYWTNVRGVEYGQSLPATNVIATVTLANGQVVTAENTILTGDPTTIFPEAPVLTTITVTPVSPSIMVGGTQAFVASGFDQFNQPFAATSTWASSILSIATINTSGLATGVATGTVVITATSGSVSGTTTLTVTPAPSVVTHPTNKDQCKNNGWKTFTNPTFKNQGQCVSYVESNPKAGKRI